MFRKPGLTRGGYLEGVIKIPKVKDKIRMEISTVTAEDADPLIADIHPCLLHLVRIGKGKRYQHLEPAPNRNHWRQIFNIENGKVKILNQLSDLEIEKGNVPHVAEITELQGNKIILGGKNGMLNLILLQPKQTGLKKSDTTIADVIEDRLSTGNKDKIKDKIRWGEQIQLRSASLE